MVRKRTAGYTLIELLLVVVIMGVIVAITVPVFRSLGGNRLSSAARSVVSVGRYARSMAVLKQLPMRVQFNLAAGVISVEPMHVRGAPTDAGVQHDTPLGEGSPPTSHTRPATSWGEVQLSRQLDRVRIDYVEAADGERYTDGTAVVVYRSNGTCTPYRVVLSEEDGATLEVRVDALSSVALERQL